MIELLKEKGLRALSWKQPFATLMFHEKIETRTWPTKYRGWVLICASKVPYSTDKILEIMGREQHDRVVRLFLKHEYSVSQNCGKAIGIGELVDCQPMMPTYEDRCFVQHDADLYCHFYENVRAIKPIDFRGQQGWKKLDDDFIDKIKIS